MSSLDVERIETIPLRVPLGRVYKGSHYQMTHRAPVVVRIFTSCGIVGEAYAADEDGSVGEIAKVIDREITPLLIGKDIRNIERCWELTRPTTYDILRDRRIGLIATAAIDTAIWDAIGKSLNEPLWRLWGGYTNELPVIEIGGYYGTGISIEDEIEQVKSRGAVGIKFKVGGLSPAEDAKRVALVRKVGGENFFLMVDANQAWTPREAIIFAELAFDQNIFWFEEPCHWDNDSNSMKDVRLISGLRVCAGQTENSAAGCRDLLSSGAIDVCNFDSSWSGGPTEWRRVAAIAQTYKALMAHHEEPQVAAHLLASIPNGTFLETFHPDRDPVWLNLVANRPPIIDGKIHLTDAPGLGWTLDEDFIKKYRIEN
ncbi:MAG: mandelate racemase/muconate lactonizing enzyme family protein [Acidimicrobiaceae bacterium]|nr:mandelate racemase/muconate lactonizing enzyme family protein [Acidimicrobiaceae bacterium]